MKTKTKLPKKLFEVIIHDKPYNVYSIEGKEHDGFNDTPKEWWVYYTDKMPADFIPPVDSEDLVPYCVGIKRHLWDIRIKDNNTSKYKWNHVNFRNNTKCELWCNNKQIYEFYTHGTAFALAKAQVLMATLPEHCYNFFNPDKENGRKIYFHGLPATIKHSNRFTWEISIYPDVSTGMNIDDWWSEYRKRQTSSNKEDSEMIDDELIENKRCGYVNWGDALSDGNIDWFRN